ncbi:PPM-type phosphatase domain [Sesbania bispinosa]|nr:PPM-type phosphatase domain [Sesbania bispinosa]
MGSGLSSLCSCFEPVNRTNRPDQQELIFTATEPLDETLGHSFCYVRSSNRFLSPTHSDRFLSPSTSLRFSPNHDRIRPEFHETGFKAISGASVSANSSVPKTVIQLDEDSAIDCAGGAATKGNIVNGFEKVPFSAPLGGMYARKKKGVSGFRKAFNRKVSEKKRPWVVPVLNFVGRKEVQVPTSEGRPPVVPEAKNENNVQWALGKAGEDRVHVVVSEEQGWLFVGIYDGFNGPDAPEFLMGHLYRAVHNELQGTDQSVGLENKEGEDGSAKMVQGTGTGTGTESKRRRLWELLAEDPEDGLDLSGSDRRRKVGPVDHDLVLSALSRALEVTELAYLDMTDKLLDTNPELALMGSCLLVALMRDEDVYVMNVGDSRAIVAHYETKEVSSNVEPGSKGDTGSSTESIVETESAIELGNQGPGQDMRLVALQLSTDHSTSIEEEIIRIKNEHPDDTQCIVNDRVKGRLKVTRAFGAGFLKQPKWNDAVLEMFRNEYIGTAPYISCCPSLRHHRLCPRDQFLILSSDGLYQYLNNEEVVSQVASFMEKFPEGDPAQHLIEELLLRAAKKAGMDFHELLDIPQGDRRKYHDDVTVMVISLEGRIWKSSGKYL